MKLGKKTAQEISKYMIWGSFVSIVFSAVGWLGPDVWLASTQWLLVSAVLALFAIYLKLD